VSRARTLGIVAGASLVLGAAAWASRAVLDEIVSGGVRQRIALVPGWHVLGVFTVAGLLLAAVGYRALTRRRGPAPADTAIADLALPLFALAVLLVPFVPGAPDWWPGLQALAGPAKWIVWVVIAAQCAWVATPHLAAVGAWAARRTLRTLTIAIWLATAAAASAGAWRLTHTTLFPSGDEPHYLILAQTLWRDGDLAIENNHTRGDYREYFGRELDPHYLTRGTDGQIYSVHPIGMPLLITPVMAAGGYTLVVILFILMAATAAAVAWRWGVATTGALGHTTLAWAAIVFSAPFLANSFTIYPEIPAALAVALALPLALRPTPDPRPWHGWAIGLLAASLPWLSTKYAPMSAALVAVAVARRWWPMQAAQPRASWLAGAVPVALPYGLALLAWAAFFYAYWGTPWPHGPYGRMSQTEVSHTVFGVPGLLFDQEYGLLAYAPAYVLAGFGFWTMIRRPGPLRRLGLETGLIVAALTFTVGAFRIWWGGSAAPGRPMVSGLLVLLLPIAVQIGSARAGSARRAAQHLLVWSGVVIAVMLFGAQEGFLLNNDRDGTSTFLGWLSPRWPLWTLFPTFIAHEAGPALVESAVWIVAVAVGSWLLARWPASTRGQASLAAMVTTTVMFAVAVGARGLLPAPEPPLPGIDLAARARMPALDSFDHVTRPYALRYRPLRVSRAAEVEPTLALGVRPGLRPEPQPLRVLHNGRFSLPAGRYRAVVRWATRDPLPARAGTPIGLQVGRIGPPLQQWPLTPVPGGEWTTEFWLPTDAGFVGFRGAPDLERSIEELRIEALDVVDAGARTLTGQVLAASAYGGTIVLFHDETTYPESTGFWTTGERQARVTIACPGGCGRGVTLRVHSGKRPTQLRLATHGWRQTIDLQGETTVAIMVPSPADGGAIELEAMTTSGFMPVEVDPSVRDRRYLGAWIEVDATGEERD
jgi:hypothetical protein